MKWKVTGLIVSPVAPYVLYSQVQSAKGKMTFKTKRAAQSLAKKYEKESGCKAWVDGVYT